MKIKPILSGLLMMATTVGFGQLKDFTAESLWQLKRVGGGEVSLNQQMAIYQSTSIDVPKSKSKVNTYFLELESGKSSRLKGEFAKLTNVRWHKDGLTAIQKNGKEKNLVFTKVKDSIIKIIDTKSEVDIIDFKLSPEGNYLLALERIKTKKTTEDMYPDFPKANVKIIDDLMYRHWDTWEDEFSNQLVLYKVKDGKAEGEGINLFKDKIFIPTASLFGGMENAVFLNEDVVIFVSKNKAGKDDATSTDTDLFSFTLSTGVTKNETEKYKGYDTHPVFHSNTNQMGWLSMARDGFEADKNDIIMRDINTGIDVNLTANHDLTVSDFIWNEKGDKIYFLSDKEATIQIFEMEVKTKKIRQITEGDYNYLSLALAGDKIISLRHDMLLPNEVYSVEIKTGKVKQLSHENDAFLAEFSSPKIEKRWVTTSDNQKMLTWVILPPNFNENEKYPTLLYCQGGPQSAVNQFFSYRWNFRLMASQGYVVVAPNRRGLPGFGQKWNDDISKDWGGQSIRDYLAAIDDVSKEKYVDKERRGAVGASYGGYSVFFIAGNHEGRFKSFIAHDGLFNMHSWYGTTEELFFANWDLGGPYWDEANKSTYEKFNPINYVNNWDTPILIIQGGKDFRVPPGQGLEAFQAAQLKGIKSKLLFFPEENHWILDGQNAMIWQSEFYSWLKETLN